MGVGLGMEVRSLLCRLERADKEERKAMRGRQAQGSGTARGLDGYSDDQPVGLQPLRLGLIW